jgi:hypothetical protein
MSFSNGQEKKTTKGTKRKHEDDENHPKRLFSTIKDCKDQLEELLETSEEIALQLYEQNKRMKKRLKVLEIYYKIYDKMSDAFKFNLAEVLPDEWKELQEAKKEERETSDDEDEDDQDEAPTADL